MPVVVIRESQLDSAVDSFESMQNKNGCADLANYLPERTHPEYGDILVELIRVDLEYGWQRGTASSIEDYINRFPMLSDFEEKIEAICFEEYRQKLQAGISVAPTDYQDRFKVSTNRWPSSRRSLIGEDSDAMEHSKNSHELATFPIIGDLVAGFRIIQELGRGAFARVYLAHQAELSERPVVLKLATRRFSDAKTLAKLQHTNIVPIYSVHRWENSEAICMPYFGANTIQDLLRAVRTQPSIPVSGKVIHDTLLNTQNKTREICNKSSTQDGSKSFVSIVPITRGALQQLDRLTYIDAVLHLTKKVVDGLLHAHNKGIVHRDLKPANILLSDDGEPMLLDFNLSEDSNQKDQSSREFIGGTLPYMAPEQMQAFQVKKSCGDIRCDLYSLGVIFHELLTGQLPYPLRHGKLGTVLNLSIQDKLNQSVGLRSLNKAVTPAVEAIVLKLLSPDASDRYQSANELREDLERQISHRPLKHISEPSWKERAQKWMIRHPRLVSTSGFGVIACLLLFSLAAILWIRTEHIEKLQTEISWSTFQENLKAAQVQIVDASLLDRDSLEEVLQACKTAMADFVLEQKSSSKVLGKLQYLSVSQRNKLNQDTAELHFLSATVQRIQADFESTAENRKSKIQAALVSNSRAIEHYPSHETPQSFIHQKEWLESRLENKLLPSSHYEELTLSTRNYSSDNVRDLCRSACLLSSQRRFQDASKLWQQASMKSPENLWVWYGLGNSLEQIGEFSRATECYSACIALNPQHPIWFSHRGRMRMRTGQPLLAKEDLTQSLNLEPNQPEASVNLAIVEYELQDYSASVQALQKALAFGYRDVQGLLVLAKAYSKLGDSDQEKRVRAQIENTNPESPNSWIARGVARAHSKPQDALDDLNRALSQNVHLLKAYESKAYILAELIGRTDEAIDVLSDAVGYFPEESALRAARGVLFARIGRIQEARDDAKTAIELDPSPSIHYQVAGIHAQLGKNSEMDNERAIELLSTSIRHGYGADLLENDPDLAPIRNHLEFQALQNAVKILSAP